MGKLMKKARGVGGVIEVMRQGQLGVRTRARAQAIEKIKELITGNIGNGDDDKFSSSTSAKSFGPTQISYLELRSRRLEKTVGCAGNKCPSAQKSNSTDECRKLSDLTNSDILADDSSSQLALSAEEVRGTRKQTNCGTSNENREIIYHFYGDNEVEELSLHGCVKSLQQWGTRGRAPPSVAQSRSNSRSKSVTRELPLQWYTHMKLDGVEPSHYTFIILFKACGCLGDLEQGEILHMDAGKRGYVSDCMVGSTLIAMYGKPGAIAGAEDLFGELPYRDVVLWNNMLSAYLEQGFEEKALLLYKQLQEDGVELSQRTYVIILRACANLVEKEEVPSLDGPAMKTISYHIGQAIHVDACRSDFLKRQKSYTTCIRAPILSHGLH